MTSSRNQFLRIAVTPVRNRKPKTHKVSSDAKKVYADKLLDLMHDEQLAHIQDSDVFVSVLAQAVQDLYRVE